MKALEPFREQINVFSGLAQVNGRALGDGPGDHARATATFLTGVHPLQDRRRRLPARHLRRPDRGEGARQVHAAGVARARARAAAARRQLRLRLHLRLHVDVVARTDQPAAGRNQSARGVRAPVRRRRQHGSESPHVQARAAEERARLRHRQPVAAAADGSAPATSASSRSTSKRSATSSGASSWPKSRTRTLELPHMERPSAIPDDYEQYTQADDRHAGGRVADRHDARRVVHARPRRQQPGVSRDRHLGRPPLDLAPSGRSANASRS